MFAGCASYKIHQVAVRAPDTYESSAEDSALCVAADPLDTKIKSKSIFNVDLNKAGYLAVNVIVRNQGKEPYQLSKSSIYLVDRNGIQLLPTSTDEMIHSVGTSLVKWFVITGLVGAISTRASHEELFVIYGSLGALSADRARKKMNEDFRSKELKETTLPAGITAYGFLYYQHRVTDGAKGYKLIVANSPAQETLVVLIR